MLPLSIAGRKPDPEWLDQLIDTVGLTDRKTHRPSQLSGGQQQRVAVARALVTRPAVVFADEPTGNLDSKASAEVLALLRRSVDELGQTVVMVTHDASAAAVADRDPGAGRRAHRARRAGRRRGVRPRPDEDGRRVKRAMTALTLRSLAARKARTALTAAAVVLGVGLISGTFILTVDDQPHVRRHLQGGHERVRRRGAGQAGGQGGLRRPAAHLGEPARAGASRAGRQGRGGRHLHARGPSTTSRASGSPRKAPNFIASAQPKPFDAFNYVEGRPPSRPGEVALDRKTAQDEGFKIGGTVELSGDGPRERLRVVGIAKFGNLESLAGANAAIVTLPEAQRLAGLRGELNEIDVIAKPGVEPGRAARPHRPGAAAERHRAHRPGAGRRAGKATSRRASASSTSPCSCSRASRCSSARSSSSTRSR